MSEYIINEDTYSHISKFGSFRTVGEVIRCRNCEHMYEMMVGYECERLSGQYHSCEPDGFCAWGVRRES